MENEIKDYLFNLLNYDQKKILEGYLKSKSTYKGVDEIKTVIEIIPGMVG